MTLFWGGNGKVYVDDATAKDILDRVDDIYAIQDVLYQDFMVDRTRLFFMPQALNIFNLKSAKKDYKAIIKLRLKEDRSLDLSNHTEAIMGIKGLYKTPGQYDFEIDMDEYFEGKDYDNVLKEIEDNIINIPYLDYSETLILKRWGKWFS